MKELNPIITIVIGTGAGMLLSVIGQKVINQHYMNTCHKHPGYNLVLTHGFLGDIYYCIKANYVK